MVDVAKPLTAAGASSGRYKQLPSTSAAANGGPGASGRPSNGHSGKLSTGRPKLLPYERLPVPAKKPTHQPLVSYTVHSDDEDERRAVNGVPQAGGNNRAVAHYRAAPESASHGGAASCHLLDDFDLALAGGSSDDDDDAALGTKAAGGRSKAKSRLHAADGAPGGWGSEQELDLIPPAEVRAPTGPAGCCHRLARLCTIM